MNEMSNIEQDVRDYYGKELQSSADLKTNACCTITDYPREIKAALANIHEEVSSRYYGCGLTIPTHIEGLSILDLGSGSGRDCYLLSQLVGEQGRVIGIDMTDEQLAIARTHREWHREKFGYARSNVDFVKGNIQALDEAGLEDNSFDVIISNCVINLATDKRAVLLQAHRVLREGGEFYFSDVYCDRRLPAELAADKELYGECLGGALYWNDFQNLARRCGFPDPRIVDVHPITVANDAVARKLEGYCFYSVSYRLFKLPALEAACEDYSQAVKYLGGVKEQAASFVLDNHHRFDAGRVVPVCGNTFMMLADTRYRQFFEFYGDFSKHFGIFPGCDTDFPYELSSESGDSASVACC